jgi:hypothetical protein
MFNRRKTLHRPSPPRSVQLFTPSPIRHLFLVALLRKFPSPPPYRTLAPRLVQRLSIVPASARRGHPESVFERRAGMCGPFKNGGQTRSTSRRVSILDVTRDRDFPPYRRSAVSSRKRENRATRARLREVECRRKMRVGRMLRKFDRERIERPLRVYPLLLAQRPQRRRGAGRPVPFCLHLLLGPFPKDRRGLVVSLLRRDHLRCKTVLFRCGRLGAKGKEERDDVGVTVRGGKVEGSRACGADSEAGRTTSVVAVPSR